MKSKKNYERSYKKVKSEEKHPLEDFSTAIVQMASPFWAQRFMHGRWPEKSNG